MSMQRSPVNTGDVLKGQYEVKVTLGQGGYGAVFEVLDRKSKEQLALKIELQRPPDNEPGLELEIGVLKQLQNSKHVTKYIDEGKIGPFRYVIMQLVGKNLSDLRYCNPQFRFTATTSTRVAIQCLEAIEDVHKIGMLHRDIKPANYAIGRTKADTRNIFILDFGMVRRYLRPDGSLRPSRPIAGFRGTARYASFNAHQNNELGRHDDLWSWLYMVIEFHQGELPWRAVETKDKIGEMKAKLSRHKLLEGMEAEYHHIYENLMTLKYEVEPQYGWIKQCLQHIMLRKKINPDDLYDWETGGVGFAKAKTIIFQPYAKQMKDRDQQVKERLPNEEPEESDA